MVSPIVLPESNTGCVAVPARANPTGFDLRSGHDVARGRNAGGRAGGTGIGFWSASIGCRAEVLDFSVAFRAVRVADRRASEKPDPLSVQFFFLPRKNNIEYRNAVSSAAVPAACT